LPAEVAGSVRQPGLNPSDFGPGLFVFLASSSLFLPHQSNQIHALAVDCALRMNGTCLIAERQPDSLVLHASESMRQLL